MKSSTITSPYFDKRGAPLAWGVTVRTGDSVRTERFPTEREAKQFAAKTKKELK